MIRVAFRRMASLFFTVLVTIIIVFFISKDQRISVIDTQLTQELADKDSEAYLQNYERLYKQQGFHLPDFYFTIKPRYHSKHINEITNPIDQARLKQSYREKLTSGSLGFRDYLPKFEWNGVNNQFHQWTKQLLTGKLGNSITDGELAKRKIWKALRWTLLILILNILLVLMITIPLGTYLAKNEGRTSDNIISMLLYTIFSMPVFWIATLMIVFFTTDEYGKWMNIFPSVGIWSYADHFLKMISLNWSKLILPLIVLVISDVAYLTIVLKDALNEEVHKPYATYLKAKGLGSSQAMKSHILPNALTPLITILVIAIPGSIAGSLIVEVIFNIPGVGRLLLESVKSADWNIVFPIVILTTVLTGIFYILGDVLIRYLKPQSDQDV